MVIFRLNNLKFPKIPADIDLETEDKNMPFAGRLSSVSTRVQPICTAVVSGLTAKLKAQGHQVVDLVYGQNTLPVPQSAANAGMNCYKGRTFPYAQCPGLPELREAYAQSFTRMGIKDITSDNVVIGCGTLELLELACQTVLEPGDQALLISPYYFLYPHRIWKPGAEMVVAPTSFESQHKLTATTLDQVLSSHPKIRMMILNTPNNPAATMYTRLELCDLAEVIGRHDLWVFADEVYHEITFGRQHVSLASLDSIAERVITFDSASKTIALGGERIGALASTNKPFLAELIKNKTNATFSTGLAGQLAAHAALTDPDLGEYMAAMRAAFQAKRDLLARVMQRDFPEAARYHLPQGTFYFSFEIPADLTVPGNYEDWMDPSMRFSIYLLNQKHIAVTPGQAAGYPTLIRLSVAVEDSSLLAVARIGEALYELGVR